LIDARQLAEDCVQLHVEPPARGDDDSRLVSGKTLIEDRRQVHHALVRTDAGMQHAVDVEKQDG